jgi:hypothetical protein
MMRRFTVFRAGDLSATHNADLVNEPDKPQFEGVVFTDGTVVVRWLTACVSTSVFDSFETLMRIHGHTEADSRHGTEVVWHDEDTQQAFAAGLRAALADLPPHPQRQEQK